MADKLERNGALGFLADPFRPTKAHAERRFQISPSPQAFWIPLGVGIAGLVMSGVGWAVDPPQFFFSYLVGWTFCLTLTLGALFFVLIHHITRAYWSSVVRRIPEFLLWSFPLLAVTFLPILLFGMHDLYHWTHHEIYVEGSPEYDELLAGKQPYLNVPFYVIRIVLYFAIWITLAYKLYKGALQQDVTADPALPAQLRKTSAWGIPVFAVTTAFASYDLLMSLDPHWYSTIFGVYIFAGAFFSANAMIMLVILFLQRRGGVLRDVISTEHYHDLGKWMFAFTAFWGYIAFSQYMLIWYGGIPEETIWYRHRLEHGWEYHTYALAIGHFLVPFVVLMARGAKRTLPLLGVMGVWFLVMQWFDLHWLAMPVLDVARGGHAAFHWLSFTCWIGLFGLYVALLVYRMGRHGLVAQNDPYLAKSLRFENI